MEYTLSQAETILLAKSMRAKGKSMHFIKETLIRRGADPQHVALIINEVAQQRTVQQKRGKVFRFAVATIGILCILVYGFVRLKY